MSLQDWAMALVGLVCLCFVLHGIVDAVVAEIAAWRKGGM
jgi:hypothetical protein